MGIVYLAKDPVIGRLVALKTLRAGIHADEEDIREFKERFTREAQAAGILTHPSIVGVYDIGTNDDGESFIAMEYAEGSNLKEILSQGRPIAYTDLALVMAQVAEALNFAHDRGIVHRDVKPANIIIRENNKAKITDFGIAKIASSAANLTMTGQFLGTPNYMAPEQVRGKGVDGRSDIFSLGICLYEALTREKPFGGDSLTTISYKIVHEEFTPPSKVDPRIPTQFDTVVTRCLAKDPEDRYQKAIHAAADLRAIAAGGTIAPSIPPATAPEIEGDDATVLSGDPSAIPTVELPNPRSDDSGSTTSPTRPRRPSIAEMVPPSLRQTIPSFLFWSIVGGILAAVVFTAIAIHSQRVDVPAPDLEREQLVARQRMLRQEALELLNQGNIEGAYQRYFELRQLAPNSPEVGRRLRTLEAIRSARMSQEQRLSEARLELARGQEFYEEGDFAEALPYFEHAFSLDPSLSAAVNYLQLTRAELEEEDRRRERASARRAPQLTTRPNPVPDSPSARQPAAPDESVGTSTLLTVVNSRVRDGYVTVAVDGRTILQENLWEEGWGFLKRRRPRSVSAARPIPSNVDEIEVWIIIENQSVRERQVLRTQGLEPGETYRLEVSYDPDVGSLHLQLI